MENNLSITHPNIARQWNYDKNGNLTPTQVTYGMRKKVWWLCENICSNGCKHEWEEQIRVRQRNGCPYCSKHKICIHDSIRYTHPTIAEQWHPTKNNELKPEDISHGSIKKVWWLCNKISCLENCNHEWEASIHSRCGKEKVGCPFCVKNSLRKVCKHNSIAYTHPEIAKEWHPTKNGDKTPEQISYGCKLKFWWRCPNTCEKGCVHDFEARVFHRIKTGMGCPYCCKATRKVCEHTSLQATHPDIAKEWHPTKNGKLIPSTITRGHSRKIWWICINNHEYECKVTNRTTCNQGCPLCINKTEQKLFETLKQKYNVIRQFKLNSCKNKTYLPFDFCIPDLKLIIEIDGIQHFKQVMNWKSPEEIFKTDIYKMEKALEEDYSFFRLYQPLIYRYNKIKLMELFENIFKQYSKIMYIAPNNEIYKEFNEHFKHISNSTIIL